EKMIKGVDLHECPDWAAECEATLDTLDAIGIGQRVFWLAKPLTDTNSKAALFSSGAAAFDDLKDTLGLPRAGVSAKEVARRVEQARKIADGIPAVFHPEPATPAQMVWLNLHAQQRGLFADMSLPEEAGD